MSAYNSEAGDGTWMADHAATEPLVTRTGQPLRRSYVLEFVQRLAGVAKIPDPRTLALHSLRHSVATDLLASGLPLHVVQARLGHADPRTPQTYLHDEHLHRSPAHRADARLSAALARRRHPIGRDRPLSPTGEGDAGAPGAIPFAVGRPAGRDGDRWPSPAPTVSGSSLGPQGRRPWR